MILLLFIASISCNQTTFKKKQFVIQAKLFQATKVMRENPKLALTITDTLLRNSLKNGNETLILLLYQIPQKAFSQLKNVDSV